MTDLPPPAAIGRVLDRDATPRAFGPLLDRAVPVRAEPPPPADPAPPPPRAVARKGSMPQDVFVPPPAKYRLADAAGQVFEWGDEAELAAWMAARNQALWARTPAYQSYAPPRGSTCNTAACQAARRTFRRGR